LALVVSAAVIAASVVLLRRARMQAEIHQKTMWKSRAATVRVLLRKAISCSATFQGLDLASCDGATSIFVKGQSGGVIGTGSGSGPLDGARRIKGNLWIKAACDGDDKTLVVRIARSK